MMKRQFSRREKLLLVLFAVLLLGCLYYILIYQPVSRTIEESDARRVAAEDQLLVDNIKLEKMKMMQAALAQLSEDSDAIVPDYDNARRVVDLLNTAMLNTESYSMTFRPLEINERIVSRSIDISFVCDSYGTVKNILSMLHNGPYRCEISAVAMEQSDAAAIAARAQAADAEDAQSNTVLSLATSGVKASLSATFYEFLN